MCPEPLTEPLAASIPDELTLYRALSLPSAQKATMEKMVRSQLEASVLWGEDSFVWAWQYDPDPFQPGLQRVLLCAARKDVSKQLTDSCKLLGCAPAILVPSAVALAAYWRLSGSEGGSVALLDVAARSTTVVVLHRGSILKCGLSDQGGDHWTDLIAAELGLPVERAEAAKLEYLSRGTPAEAGAALPGCMERALGLWCRQLREVYAGCVEGVPAQNRPGRCVLFGRASRTPGLQAVVADTLGLEVRPPPRPPRLSLADDVELDQAATAIGAALCQLEADRPVASLAVQARPQRPAIREFAWRWAAILAWLVGVVAALYGLDRHEAWWLRGAVERVRSSAGGPGGLEQQLAIARYLERAGATPLAILEEISSLAPGQVMLTRWSYDRNGEVRISGTAPNEQEFQAFLEKLRDSAMLGHVEPRGTRREQNTFRFDDPADSTGSRDAARPAGTAGRGAAGRTTGRGPRRCRSFRARRTGHAGGCGPDRFERRYRAVGPYRRAGAAKGHRDTAGGRLMKLSWRDRRAVLVGAAALLAVFLVRSDAGDIRPGRSQDARGRRSHQDRLSQDGPGRAQGRGGGVQVH